MSIFGPQSPGPTRINQVQLNQSWLGLPVPVGMGRFKVQQSILWVDGFASTNVPQGGGKGVGGGKNGDQQTYTADVIAGLCAGDADFPVIGIGDVWSGQSWLRNTSTSETYTITSGTPIYTPANPSLMTGDAGVGFTRTYSSAVTDLGSGGSVTLAGSHIASLKRLSYGTTLTTGTYSVNPANNDYHFSPSDVGLTVTVYYTFALSAVTKQQIALVPSGLNVPVSGNVPFAADAGVVYTGESNPLNGQPLQLVSGTPSVGEYTVDPGSYSVTGSPGSYTVTVVRAASYTFATADIAEEVQLTYTLDNSSALQAGTSQSLAFLLMEGYPGQEPWSLLTTNYPSAALGYSGIALALYNPMSLGYGAQLQQNVFEVLTADGWGGGITDCSPVQCILRVLTNKAWGLGAGVIPFPASAIDNGTGGTWGTPGAGVTIEDSSAVAWFAANGFFISPMIDRQDTAASVMSRWLEAGCCAAFMSEGLLKLVPYGDTSTAGNGAIWTAPAAFDCALDDTIFIPKGKGKDSVKITTPVAYTDAFNKVQVSWNNRASQYAPEITPEEDPASVNRWGRRIEDPQQWDFIHTLPSATFAASMRVKRNVYIRNQFEFTLPFAYTWLEPMTSVVQITTSCAWAVNTNNPLGIVTLPVRVVKIVDNPDGTLDVTAEDYPFGANQPVIYNKTLAGGQPQPNQYADPGATRVVLYGATNEQTNFQGNEIWIGAVGESALWGGCNVYASMDGDKYKQIGSIRLSARLGALSAALASGSDPDVTNAMVVTLADNCAPLLAGTTADADIGNTLCFVDGELISYSACAVTDLNTYTADTYLRRGQLGSPILSHSIGGVFLQVDQAVMRYAYDPSWAGLTIYLKFQAVNAFGNSARNLSDLTAVTFDVPPQAIAGAVSGGVVSFGVIGTPPLAPLRGLGHLTGIDLPY